MYVEKSGDQNYLFLGDHLYRKMFGEQKYLFSGDQKNDRLYFIHIKFSINLIHY